MTIIIILIATITLAFLILMWRLECKQENKRERMEIALDQQEDNHSVTLRFSDSVIVNTYELYNFYSSNIGKTRKWKKFRNYLNNSPDIDPLYFTKDDAPDEDMIGEPNGLYLLSYPLKNPNKKPRWDMWDMYKEWVEIHTNNSKYMFFQNYLAAKSREKHQIEIERN